MPRRSGGRLLRLPGTAVLTVTASVTASSHSTATARRAARRSPRRWGWNSWNSFGRGITEVQMRQAADAMVSSGIWDADYRYVVVTRVVSARASARRRLCARPLDRLQPGRLPRPHRRHSARPPAFPHRARRSRRLPAVHQPVAKGVQGKGGPAGPVPQPPARPAAPVRDPAPPPAAAPARLRRPERRAVEHLGRHWREPHHLRTSGHSGSAARVHRASPDRLRMLAAEDLTARAGRTPGTCPADQSLA